MILAVSTVVVLLCANFRDSPKSAGETLSRILAEIGCGLCLFFLFPLLPVSLGKTERKHGFMDCPLYG